MENEGSKRENMKGTKPVRARFFISHFRSVSLLRRLFLYFAFLLVVSTCVSAVVGMYLMRRMVRVEAQRWVRSDLRAAWAVYDGELEHLRHMLECTAEKPSLRALLEAKDAVALQENLELMAHRYKLDFLTITDKEGKTLARGFPPFVEGDHQATDSYVAQALHGEHAVGTQIIPQSLLRLEGEELIERAFMIFEPTPKTKPRAVDRETSGMVIKAAVPIRGANGETIGVLYGGKVLNRNYDVVDRVKDIVFKGERYKNKEIGTVTIFQWDLRISTNVRTANGHRAIGTRVSSDVYDQVLENGLGWYNRAFVVNDWYITAYEPIRDIDGAVIGILYVGVLEAKYADMRRDIMFVFLAIAILGGALLVVICYAIARRIVRPIIRLHDGALRLGKGHLDEQIEVPGTRDEIAELTEAFNDMAKSLRSDQEEMKRSNRELQELNRSYFEMLGMVTHELKNLINPVKLYATSFQSGLMGKLNEEQGEAMDAIVRNLDRFDDMIRKYLSLSRVERSEVEIAPEAFDFRRDLVDKVLVNSDKEIRSHDMRVENRVPEGLTIWADRSLLTVVVQNLTFNAVRYGRDGGEIRIFAEERPDEVRVNVWNEGEGIPADRLETIFGKFTRLEREGARGKIGTGLGLFLARQIIEKHGGRIWAESEEGKFANLVFTIPKKTTNAQGSGHGVEREGGQIDGGEKENPGDRG
jgi:two-component system NtrC family sensor kinase